MGIKISDMAPDASIGGAELIPVSDAGSPKSITPAGIKGYVIDQIEAIAAATSVSGADGVFILQGGVLKPVDIDVLCQHAIDTVWGKAAETAPANADKLALKDDAGVEKTVALSVLAEYVRATVEAAILDVSNLDDGSGALASTDYMLVTQGTAGKRIQVSHLTALVYASLAAHVAALTAVTTPADTDVLYVIQGGTAKKVTLTTLKTVLGSCIAPASTTENYVPQWSSAQKTLKDGLVVRTAVRAPGTASDSSLATEKAVVDAITASITRTGGDTDGEVVQRFGAATTEGFEVVVVDKTVTLGAVAGVAVFTVPAGAIIKAVQANVATAATAGGTSVKIGVGVNADPDAYGKTTVLTANAKINTLLAPSVLSAEAAIEAFPCATDGSAGDTAFTAGTLRVRIIYEQLASLADA